ncbi:MAG: kinesin-like protein [archaeon]|nr:kinesin-like protein [archaeon]
MRKNLGVLKKGGIAEEIAQLKQRREDRKLKEDKKNQLAAQGQKGMDEAFEKMVKKRKEQYYNTQPSSYLTSESSKIFVATRKRPLSKKEISNNEIDCVSVVNPRICVHECKIQVDGITKYLEDHDFFFDASFGENSSTRDVYNSTICPIVPLVLSSGIVTCFAYGQTGSGKTYTMKGIQEYAIEDLYNLNDQNQSGFDFYISFYEIYGGRLYDLLNNRNVLQVLDDKKGKVQIYGLIEILADTKEQMHSIIDSANNLRTTHNTVTNETSSRSHAICNIVIKKSGSEETFGKLTLVDLAGSERAQETQSNNRQRRAEGAEINKSLLALKECIRALEENKNSGSDQHVPFRASKLTHVLRDSFISKSDMSRIIMISCVSPVYTCANHTINTLRYSDRLKEKSKTNCANVNANRGLNKGSGVSGGGGSVSVGGNPAPQKNFVNPPQNPSPANIPKSSVYSKPSVAGSKFNKEVKPNKSTPQNKTQPPNIPNDNDKGNDDNDEWEYLKRTCKKRDGKLLSDEYIKYHQLTDKLISEEDDIISTHLTVIKEDAQLIQKESELIQKSKSGSDDFKIEDYVMELEKVVKRKIQIYSMIDKKIEQYKKDIKLEDELRKKVNPNAFMDDD